jgi:hypothetical protein
VFDRGRGGVVDVARAFEGFSIDGMVVARAGRASYDKGGRSFHLHLEPWGNPLWSLPSWPAAVTAAHRRRSHDDSVQTTPHGGEAQVTEVVYLS